MLTRRERAARDRVTIRQFHYPAPVTSAQTILDAIDRALTPRTRLVMIGHVVLLGQINQVRPIADLVRRGIFDKFQIDAGLSSQSQGGLQ